MPRHRVLTPHRSRWLAPCSDAMSGKGVDRHLFALYVVAKGRNMSSNFLNNALSMPWKLSTSQQPQVQTRKWPAVKKGIKSGLVHWWDDQGNKVEGGPPSIYNVFSPGGGFGPVADDGCALGICYLRPRARVRTATRFDPGRVYSGRVIPAQMACRTWSLAKTVSTSTCRASDPATAPTQSDSVLTCLSRSASSERCLTTGHKTSWTRGGS